MDKASINMYIVLMRLAFLEVGEHLANVGPNDVFSAQNQEMVVEAFKKGIVLLKTKGLFPLPTNQIKILVVIWPHANATKPMIGNYVGIFLVLLDLNYSW